MGSHPGQSHMTCETLETESPLSLNVHVREGDEGSLSWWVSVTIGIMSVGASSPHKSQLLWFWGSPPRFPVLCRGRGVRQPPCVVLGTHPRARFPTNPNDHKVPSSLDTEPPHFTGRHSILPRVPRCLALPRDTSCCSQGLGDTPTPLWPHLMQRVAW